MSRFCRSVRCAKQSVFLSPAKSKSVFSLHGYRFLFVSFVARTTLKSLLIYSISLSLTMIGSPPKHSALETFRVDAAKLRLAAKYREGTTMKLVEAQKAHDEISLQYSNRRRFWFLKSNGKAEVVLDCAKQTLTDAKRVKENADELYDTCVQNMSIYNLRGQMFRDKCAVTGVVGCPSQIGYAYLLPTSSAPFYFQKFGFDDYNDDKNAILLSANIESAYNTERLCFEMTDLGAFTMRIWDPRVRRMQLFAGSHQRIGDFENVEFTFPEHEMPATRLLSFHAQCSYRRAIRVGWVSSRCKSPQKYGSPLTDDLLFCRLEAQHLDIADSSSLSGPESTWDMRNLSMKSNSSFEATQRVSL